jgi:serine/threonine-protein kinase
MNAPDRSEAEHAHVKALFGEVCDLPDDAQRRRHLATLTDDAALIESVLTLLALESEPTRIGAPVAAVLGAAVQAEEGELSVGDRLGAWTLEFELGRGGMGRVFAARRSDGHFEQRAAIKLLHGWPSASALAQLARERQILASLDHPHIARLIDGGATPRGQPYLVLAYVQGERIDRYCQLQALGLDARLALFGQVCEAVAYAHRRLVVHCDIKPGNVLVDEHGRAMLLDFGVAQLQGPEAQGGPASAGLTPGYASPEQLAGLPAGTGSDIYSLGRLLDELLRPLGERAPRRAEWQAIVAKATAAQAGERYLGVAELQADLQRYRQHLPLAALPRRRRYLAQKFVRRRWPWLLVGAGATLMAGGFTLRVVQERDRALQAEALARQEAATTRQVSDLMVGLFEGADPSVSGRPDLSARTLVDKGRERIASGLADQPPLLARMQAVLGRVYENMGQPLPAITLYEQAVAQEHRLNRPEREAALLSRLAMAVANTAQGARAVEPARRALALREAEHADALALADAHDALGYVLSRTGSFAEAAQHLDWALATRRARLGSAHLDIAGTLHHLGMLAASQGQFEGAESRFREALAMKRQLLGDQHPSVLNTLQTLAAALGRLQRLDEAEGLLRELVTQRRKLLGEPSAPVAAALNELASVQQDAGRAREAAGHYEEALAINEALSGRRSTPVAVNLNNLATALEDAGDPRAEALYRESLATRLSLLPAQDLGLARARHNLGRWLLRQGRLGEAEPLLQQAAQARRNVLAADHDDRLDSELTLAELALTAGDGAAARAALAQVASYEPAMRAPRRIALRRAQALALRAQSQPAQARLQAALTLAGQTWPARHIGTLRLRLELAEMLAAAGQGAAARSALQAAQAALAEQDPRSPLRRRAQALQRRVG